MDRFVVYVEWSQTDHANYIVSAEDREDAERVLKEKLKGSSFFQIMGAGKISKDFS